MSALTREEVLERVKKSGQNFRDCHWMPGDASNRFYGRLTFEGLDQTKVLMVLNAPEAFKSEEASRSSDTGLAELPFVMIGRHLERSGLRVPHIEAVDPKSIFLVLEDLGDDLLYDVRLREPATEAYKNALRWLAKFQKLASFAPVSSRAYDRELLRWEADHFLEYAIDKNDKAIERGERQLIQDWLYGICDDVAKAERVVVHRDFHSKNILVLKDNAVAVIDFQDALMGAADYDLASLLRDSYVTMSDQEENALIQVYEQAAQRVVDRKLYGSVSLQRNLKAIGRFFYIHKVKGRPTHLPYVKPTLRRVERTLLEQKDGEKILTILRGLFVDEFKH